MGARVLSSYLKRAVLAERVVHSVFIKDRSRVSMNVRQSVTLSESKQSLGDVLWRQIIYIFFKPEKTEEMSRVFSLFTPAYIFPRSILKCLHGTAYG